MASLEEQEPLPLDPAPEVDTEKNEGGNSAPSTQFVNPVTILVMLGATIVCAYLGQVGLALFCGFLFIFFLLSWLWGRASVRHVDYTLLAAARGVFPGQSLPLTRVIYNDKLLPLIWLELLCPCDRDGPLLPEDKYIIENPQNQDDTPAAERHLCLYTFSLLKWKQTLRFTDEWMARHRGICTIEGATLRSGDGFGFYVASREIAFPTARRFAVYPALMEVNVDLILQDMWDSRSATQGCLEDITLLKTVRDYRPGDPARRINQRLLAKGQGLMVNQYEVVTPDSVLFVLDAASFACAPAARFEEALSILASLLVELDRRGIGAGLLAPASAWFPQSCVLPLAYEDDTSRMLELLAAAARTDAPLEGAAPVPAPELMGQTYYLAYGWEEATSLPVLSPFPPHKAQLLLTEPGGPATAGGDMRVRDIRAFQKNI